MAQGVSPENFDEIEWETDFFKIKQVGEKESWMHRNPDVHNH